MSIILDGTNGIMDINGTATTTAVSGTTTGTGLFFPATNVMALATSGVEALRIDASGNVGIGTSSPNQKVQVNAGTSSFMQFTNTTTGSTSGVGGLVGLTSGGDLWLWNQSNYNVVFGSNNGERMRINSSGNVGIGTSSPAAQLHIVSSAAEAARFESPNGAAYNVYTSWMQGGSRFAFVGSASQILASGSANDFAIRAENNLVFASGGSSERARIDSSGNLLLNTTTSPSYAIQTGTTKNGSPNVRWEWGPSIVNAVYYVVPAGAGSGVYLAAGNISWSSNSDERLKNITANIENAVQSVNSLRAVRFTWKSDEENKSNVGLIAQDILAVLPEAVTEDRGYYGVKYTEVIPLLVAAIQELSAKNDALEARLAALETK